MFTKILIANRGAIACRIIRTLKAMPGEYLVTGGREVLSALIVHPADENGNQRWELEHSATIHDVTHLGCRAAVYTPASTDQMCSPENAPLDAFQVPAGAPMPPVPGCNKQDYAVLVVIGLPKEG